MSNNVQCRLDAGHSGWHGYVDGATYAVAWAPGLHYDGDAFVLALEAMHEARRAGIKYHRAGD